MITLTVIIREKRDEENIGLAVHIESSGVPSATKLEDAFALAAIKSIAALSAGLVQKVQETTGIAGEMRSRSNIPL